MTRTEHVAWAKQRALKLLAKPHEALTSLASDLGKHPETQGHPAIFLGTGLMLGGHLATAEKIREFIEGIN